MVNPISEIKGKNDGTPTRGLTMVVATWIRWLNGKNDHGKEHDIDDPNKDFLHVIKDYTII